MQVFITGTDTNIGKTLVASWLCLHTGYDYFKPIQTGSCEGIDSQTVFLLSGSKIFPEAYVYHEPVSPHLAAKLENQVIDIKNIKLPNSSYLIVEGAGGVLVPINENTLMIDLIKHFNIPVMLVVSARLGTINHTLLSLEALRKRDIDILGVTMIGDNLHACEAIEFYGKCKVLAQVPTLPEITKEHLKKLPLGITLKEIFEVSHDIK
jgi:dethiobiotin synthetase